MLVNSLIFCASLGELGDLYERPLDDGDCGGNRMDFDLPLNQCIPSSPSGSLFVKGFDLRHQTASLGRLR